MAGRRAYLGTVAAGVTAGLAGCGRSLRSNRVPGGVRFVNGRATAVSVVVRALLQGEGGEGGPTPTPLGDTATVEGRFTIPAQSTRVNGSFFPNPGTYAVEARVDGSVATGRITLYRTLGGGLGADTVTVRTPASGGVSVSVSDVD
ncbi:hypothetical protein RYH80_04730 [Halobaculum sp. MBLA0147]|uniref:hypothetical protein n=1 Tax=Halobaculum sp. MBLA0147 TaxID=3079934 RepID=UPI0035254069